MGATPESVKKIKGGVCAPQGFLASGMHAGIKKRKKDVALIYSETPAAAAGVFTQSRTVAACVENGSGKKRRRIRGGFNRFCYDHFRFPEVGNRILQPGGLTRNLLASEKKGVGSAQDQRENHGGHHNLDHGKP